VKLSYLPWLASRSAGLVAFGLVTATVVLGLLMASGLVTGQRKIELRRFHEPLALAALAATALHGVLLLFDGWLHAGPLQLLVPFTMTPHRLFTGIGVLASYGLVLFAASFYLRRRLKPGQWRRVHQAAFVVWGLGAIHALGAGSDAGGVVMRAMVVLTGLAVALLVAARYSNREPSAPPPAPRAPTPGAPVPTPPRSLWADTYSDLTRSVSP
jgi:methionine sulfoxide reductase heme-binding subunit